MRKYILLAALALSTVLTSCLDDNDHYSVGKFWIDFGVIDKQGEDDFTVILDDGDVIYPVAGMVYGHHLSDGQRVMVDFTILDDKTKSDTLNEYFVKINSIEKVLKKGILDITPAIEDSIGNDPIVIKHAWISQQNLLTVHMRYWGNNKVHYINLVKEPGTLTAADQPIELELRHNSRNDRELYAMTAFVSFDLSSIKIAGLDSVKFKIKSVDYDDEVHYIEKTFHY